MNNFSTGLSRKFIENIKLFYIFRSHIKESSNKLIVTNDDNVYTLGQNSFGDLGLGHHNRVSEPTIIPELCNKQIIEFNSGSSYCIARSIDGKLYSFGSDECLGYKAENVYNKPKLIENLINESVIQVSCGYSHTLVLTENGEVFSWGSNMSGQIGISGKVRTQLVPVKIDGFNGEKLQSISCGYKHSMALTVEGNVFIWGLYDSDELSKPKKSVITTREPKLIEIKDTFKKISCGLNHSLLLSINGDIYSFGYNYKSQLGYKNLNDKPDNEKQLIPKIIETKPRNIFSDIYCNWSERFSAALSTTDLCYIWGECGDEIIDTPMKTGFRSCSELLMNTFGITIKTERNPYEVIKTFIKSKSLENDYEQLEYLSEGGFGQVYKGVKKSNQKCYAIKRLHFVGTNVYNEKLLREIQLMARLKSQYVVELIESWIEINENSNDMIKDYFLYIQMELCLYTWKQLNQKLYNELHSKNDSLCESIIGYYIMSEFMKELIEGLNFLHKNNIIHRDLKPQNIMITEFENGRYVKIADFGQSCIHETILVKNKYEGISHTGDVGDEKYKAPELEGFCGRFVYNEKVDIYSLGVILEEFVCNLNLRIESIDSSNNPILIKIKTKNQSLKDIIILMKSNEPENRPNCEEILRLKNKYFMNLLELNEYTELVNYLQNLQPIDSENFRFDYMEKKFCFALITMQIPSKHLTLYSQLVGIKLIEVKTGNTYCIARTVEGKLYSFGSNDSNQLGYQTNTEENNKPKLIESLIKEHITQVSCGYGHTLALTIKGEVFAWGWNEYGQLGFNKSKANQSVISRVNGFNGEKIQSVSCGYDYSMALTENGNVFCWGRNDCGQLGINSTIDSCVPQMIEMKDKQTLFKKISCGGNFSLILSLNGDIYSFGGNNHYQLGFDKPRDYLQLIPRMIETEPRIIFSDICCHYRQDFSAALSSTCDYCYIWGELGEEVIKFPKKSERLSFEEILSQEIKFDENFRYKSKHG